MFILPGVVGLPIFGSMFMPNIFQTLLNFNTAMSRDLINTFIKVVAHVRYDISSDFIDVLKDEKPTLPVEKIFQKRMR